MLLVLSLPSFLYADRYDRIPCRHYHGSGDSHSEQRHTVFGQPLLDSGESVVVALNGTNNAKITNASSPNDKATIQIIDFNASPNAKIPVDISVVDATARESENHASFSVSFGR